MKMNEDELAHGLSGTSGSWHAQYKGNAWVYCGGFDPRLNEGDVLAVFSQYGEIEDLHLVRDTDTGKSKGFAFLKYEDERSTVLAVDNLNAAQLMGRTLRVDHTEYRPPKILDAEQRGALRAKRGADSSKRMQILQLPASRPLEAVLVAD